MALYVEKFLNQVEYDQLNASLLKNEKSCFRDTTLLWMLLHTGARVSEVLAIRPRDFIPDGKRVHIIGLKNSNPREMPLTPFLYERMQTLAEGVDADSKIFKFGYFRAREIWNWWRPAPKKIHSLRHYRAQEIYKRTKDVRLVQKVLGHRYLSTTLIYLDYEYTADELRRAMI